MAKAKLVEIKWDANQQTAEEVPGEANNLEVQFNPPSLKVAYANNNTGGDQPGGSSSQYTGSASSRMSVELLFDTTETGADVRAITEKVSYYLKPKEDDPSNRVPPGIRFEWGSFVFEGIMNSMDETLDYFSEEGIPLRATLQLSLSRNAAVVIRRDLGRAGSGGAPGTSPLDTARLGESVMDIAARHNLSANWKGIASANNIDDPLRLSAGVRLDIGVGIS